MRHRRLINIVLVTVVTSLSIVWVPIALAEDLASASVVGTFRQAGNSLMLIEQRPAETITLYADRSKVTLPSHARWRYMCGSDTSNATVNDLQQLAEITRGEIAGLASKRTVISEAGLPGSQGLNIIFESPCPLPPAAAAALESVATYIESQFGDPIEVRILVIFTTLNPGIIGSTGSTFFTITYPSVRDGLIASMDADDFIQNFLPAGFTIPVRYTTNLTPSNESTIYITRANLSAGIGRIDGLAATMQFNDTMSFDYDPSNGISAGQLDFQSVVAHEIGHVMGFTSAVDPGGFSMDAMDMFRFERFDGAGNFNPDTTIEFSTAPRSVDAGIDAVSDVFAPGVFNGEYRMANGVSQQASHFRDNLGIGIMDPTFATGQSFWPDFFQVPDFAMFDAIGWTYPRVTSPGGLPLGSCCTANGCMDGLSEPACEDNISFYVDCLSGPENLIPPAGCSAGQFLRADLDQDGDVDHEDVSLYLSDVGQSRGFNGHFIQGTECSSGFCVCINATGSCDTEHPTKGCDTFECCQSVCAFDPFCCTNGWDLGCATTRAGVQCSLNDDCDQASVVFDGITAYRTDFATTDGEPDCLTGNCLVGTNDIWFQYTATCTGNLTVSTCDSNFDSTIQIYQGTSCPPTVQRICEDDDVNCPKCETSFRDCSAGVVCSVSEGPCTTVGVPGTAIISVTNGIDYLIRVGGWGGAFGSGNLSITCN